MSPIRTDAQLWVGLALLGWCSALIVHKQLAVIRTASSVAELPSPPSSRVNQQTQDAIKIRTLTQLLQSPNREIREACTKIIAERALQSAGVWRLLRQQLRSKTDRGARIQALSILVEFGPDSLYYESSRRGDSRSIDCDGFFHPANFTALVTCLCNLLPAARDAEILHQHHHSAEADALWFAIKLLNHNDDLILRAGLVKKWLVNYPLNLQNPRKTKAVVIGDMILNYEYSDDYERLLCCLLYDLTENAQARQQMAEHGLGQSTSPDTMLKVRHGNRWGERRQHRLPCYHEIRLDESEQERVIGEVPDVTGPMMDDWSPAMVQNVRALIEQRDALIEARDAHLGIYEERGPLTRPEERRQRRREENAEERALRGRRREAMVFAEAGRPMRQEDIIESRRGANSDDVHEDGLERMIEAVQEMATDAGQVTTRRQRTWTEFLVSIRPDGSIRE